MPNDPKEALARAQIKKLCENFIAVMGTQAKVANFLDLTDESVVYRMLKCTASSSTLKPKIHKALGLKDNFTLKRYLEGKIELRELLQNREPYSGCTETVLIDSMLYNFPRMTADAQGKVVKGLLQELDSRLHPKRFDPYEGYPDVSLQQIYKDNALEVAKKLSSLAKKTHNLLGNGLVHQLQSSLSEQVCSDLLVRDETDLVRIIWKWEGFADLARLIFRVTSWGPDSVPTIETRRTYFQDIDALFVDLWGYRIPADALKIKHCLNGATQSEIVQRLAATNLTLEEWRSIRLGMKPIQANQVDMVRVVAGDLSERHFSRDEWLGQLSRQETLV